MKKILLILLMILNFSITSSASNESNDSDKTALLMVHFGTTFDDTRAATIDAINEKAKDEFPEMKVVEAYTSRIIISRLAKRGIVKPTPREALLKLAAEGYTHVFIQSTNVIDGIEAESLRNEADYMVPFFKDLRIGRPLLYSTEDCLNVEKILAERYSSSKGKNSAVVLIGHGTETPANAIYSQMDYMFGAEGNHDFHVATVEGYPTFGTTLAKLRSSKVKNVTLVPFMFVAGDHARNDIAGDWKEDLEKEGFKVSVIIEGLGQIPAIQDIYIQHIKDGLKERPLTPVERKAAFIKENL
ncbi:MAG: sirohydrochlorin cobaltochelatase [Muribaculaceae bacterium]|nr:sirohydrochlorin cobaltochelatase [Muribaculaceae bacterium]